MKVKTPKDSPIAVLYAAASRIVAETRKVFENNGQDAREIRLPILMHGTDLRVTIEAGPKIAARNAIEHAQMQASGKPVEPTVDMDKVIDEARALLAQYASEIKDSRTYLQEHWDQGCQDKRLYDRCVDAVKGLAEVERLL